MVAVINDPGLEQRIIAERQRTGADRYDEVWEGVYMMAPMANNEHQSLVGQLTTILEVTVGWTNLGTVLPGANVSDRRDNWKKNYRCPDVLVLLNGTSAENRGTHWYGGPDLAVEIVSPGDRSRDKLDFYAKVGTKELLIVDRDPWQLELYRLIEGKLGEAGRSTVAQSDILNSDVVPLSWQLVAGEKRPQIHVAHADGQRQWTI